MNKLLKPNYLPWITLSAGAVGFLLRIWLLNTAVDQKGFLVSGHIAETLIWVLSAIMMAVLVLGTGRLLQAGKFSFNFPRSLAGAVGCSLGAIGIAFCCVSDLTLYSDTLTVLAAVLGFFCAASLLFIGYCRYQGKQPHFLLHAVICVFLMMRLVSLYRHWSASPQLQDYCFQLLSTVCLMLAAYHRTAFDANTGTRRRHVIFHLATVFFCCLSVAGGRDVAFYLGAGAWMFTDLCSLAPMPREEQ